jgi:hypothetical protein
VYEGEKKRQRGEYIRVKEGKVPSRHPQIIDPRVGKAHLQVWFRKYKI